MYNYYDGQNQNMSPYNNYGRMNYTTLQLLREGVALPQAQSTGTTLAFTTFIQVTKNNCNCNICSSPVTLQVKNSTATTLNNVNITVDKEQ